MLGSLDPMATCLLNKLIYLYIYMTSMIQIPHSPLQFSRKKKKTNSHNSHIYNALNK